MEILEDIIEAFPGFLTNEDVNGGDLVDFISDMVRRYEDARPKPVIRSLYEDAKAQGLEMNHHETDLYLKDTPEARALLAEHDKQLDGWNVQVFTSQIDGERWLDIPFNYDPAWPSSVTKSQGAI